MKDGQDDEVSSRRLLLRAQFGVSDGLDLYGMVGLSDAQFEDEAFEGTLGPGFGAGVRYGLFSFPESAVKVVIDLQGEVFRSEDGSKKLEHQAYHLAVYLLKEIGAAGRVGYLYPYGGLRISYARYDADGGVDDTTGDDVLGVFGGVDSFVSPDVCFFGEVHLFDETGIYLGVGYRF